MSGLKVGRGLELPVDVAGEAIAILAKRGAGKTNTATVLVEEIHGAGVQVVIVDPVGAWWGLRSSADGGEGLPIPILGGQHGDVPLEQTAGKLIADVVVDTGQSMLLDLSDFPSKGAVARFVTDFAEELYRRKGRSPDLLHLVLEEADEFAPQGQRAETARMRGAIEQIVRRGRSRGLGVTLITQRSAVLNKDVLTQTDVLVVMRTTGPHDVRAIKEWVSSKGDERASEVLDSLPSLETGEAWIWNPERDLLQRAKIRRRRTFDSSQTPKAGERRAAPKKAAPIDLTALGAEIQATADRVKASDPKQLQARVRELERELAARPTEVEEKLVVEEIEVPAVSDGQIGRLETVAKELLDVAESLRQFGAEILTETARVAGRYAITTKLEPVAARRPGGTPPPAPRAPTRPPAPAPALDGDEPQLKAGARRIVETLARHYPMRVTRAQLGTLTGFKITGGTFQTYFSQLKRLGLIVEESREISITQAGLDYVGETPPAPQTTEELLDMWRGALKAGARAMLDVLVAQYPASVAKEQLAELVEMTPTGGTFQTYLSTLRRNGLAEVDGGEVTASDTLFIGTAVST